MSHKSKSKKKPPVLPNAEAFRKFKAVAEGKERPQQIAARRPLSGQVTIMTDPELIAQERFIQAIMNDANPLGARETQVAYSIAMDHWRINRVRAIEHNFFAREFNTIYANSLMTIHPEIFAATMDAKTFLDNTAELNRLSLYESRLHRNVQRSMKMLNDLRKERELRNLVESSREPKVMTASAGTAPQDPTLCVPDSVVAEPAPAPVPAAPSPLPGFVVSILLLMLFLFKGAALAAPAAPRPESPLQPGAFCPAPQASPEKLPDAPGKSAFVKVCGTCHAPEVVIGTNNTRKGWTDVVNEMISKGARATPRERRDIVAYLARSYPMRKD